MTNHKDALEELADNMEANGIYFESVPYIRNGLIASECVVRINGKSFSRTNIIDWDDIRKLIADLGESES